jgi:hypothetical protein
MSKPSPPTPPDPKETAAAQTGTNVSTAIANAALGNVNQVTPQGNLTYNQTGSKSIYDPSTGQTYDVPTYTATQTLSPQEQAIFDQGEAAKGNLATTANNASSFLKDYLGKPADLNTMNQATADNIFRLGSARLDPMWKANQDAFDAKMAAQGVAPGSQAYDNAYRDFNAAKNDAYNSLALSGQNQAFSEAQASRNQPINEITALLSGSQVSQPNYAQTNMPTIPTTDYAGIVNNNFNQQMGIYNSQMQQSNALMGGMFSLASAPLYGMRFSDERLKEDVEKVGKVNGQNIYKFRYKSGGPMQLGVLAQEVEKKQPDAVKTDPVSGYKMVDYGKALKLGAA